MRCFFLLIIVLVAFSICSCGARKQVMSCVLEIRNDSKIDIPELKLDKGRGFFSLGYVKAGTRAVLDGAEIPKAAKSVSIIWFFDKNMFFTNTLILPPAWNKARRPEIVILISDRISKLELGPRF